MKHEWNLCTKNFFANYCKNVFLEFTFLYFFKLFCLQLEIFHKISTWIWDMDGNPTEKLVWNPLSKGFYFYSAPLIFVLEKLDHSPFESSEMDVVMRKVDTPRSTSLPPYSFCFHQDRRVLFLGWWISSRARKGFSGGSSQLSYCLVETSLKPLHFLPRGENFMGKVRDGVKCFIFGSGGVLKLDELALVNKFTHVRHA